MARLGRVELPTSCFGGTRSIHLSYSRVLYLYHTPRAATAASISPPPIRKNCFDSHSFATQNAHHDMGMLGHLFYPWGFILQALALIHFFRRRGEFFWI